MKLKQHQLIFIFRIFYSMQEAFDQAIIKLKKKKKKKKKKKIKKEKKNLLNINIFTRK